MTTSNTADVGGMDGDSVQLEEETHEAVEAKIDQDLTQTCLDTRHFLATWSGLLGGAASLHNGSWRKVWRDRTVIMPPRRTWTLVSTGTRRCWTRARMARWWRLTHTEVSNQARAMNLKPEHNLQKGLKQILKFVTNTVLLHFTRYNENGEIMAKAQLLAGDTDKTPHSNNWILVVLKQMSVQSPGAEKDVLDVSTLPETSNQTIRHRYMRLYIIT